MNVQAVPPIARSNLVEQERRNEKGKAIEIHRQQLSGRASKVSEGHPNYSIEEDFLILAQAGIVRYLTLVSSKQQVEPDTWLYDQSNKDFAYEYHKTFLSMLNSIDKPRSHWLLKSPEHALYLDTFFRHYPNAVMIMTHRRLDEVLP